MGDLSRGDSELELSDGRLFVLHFGNAELYELEKVHAGKALADVFFSGSPARMSIIEALRIGLVKRFKRMTTGQVCKWLDAEEAKDSDAFGRITESVFIGILSGNGASAETIEHFRESVRAESSGGIVIEPKAINGPVADGSTPSPLPAATIGGS